jgi:hypothetical protein
MSTPDPFEHLLQKAFKKQSMPPVPPRILDTWQAPARSNAWLWLLPGLVFSMGLVLGVALAPLGLGAAFASLQASLLEAWAFLPKTALYWLLALCLALAVLLLDGLTRVWRR